MTPPGVSRLFADTLSDFERVRRFYPAGPPLAYTGAAPAYPESRRAAMAGLLRRQNSAWGMSAAAEQRLQEFAQRDSVAVLTGQQVGLFGGPLLTLYKAMTAVQLAERWRRQGIPAVPIFWMASQDHDQAEVDHAWVLDEDAQLVRLEADLAGPAGAAAGGLTLGAAAATALDTLARICGAPSAAMEAVRAAYRPGATLADAFAHALARWFAPWGLLIFDPMQAPEAATLWQPYYLAALERQGELAEALQRRASELKAAGYHAQVEQTAAAGMLFFHRNGQRRGLRRHGGGWLEGERGLEPGEARRFIEEHPESVSGAALLRPLLQDVAFPTAAQVTGPAETAYMAQSAVLYEAFGVAGPRPYPRASLTLLEPKARRLLQKYALTLPDLWREPASELVARQALPADLEQLLANARGHFEDDFAHLEQALAALDPTLRDAAQGAGQKIRHQWEQLQARAGRSLARRNGEVAQQARYLDHCLYPGRQLQERVLAAAYWMGRYPDLLTRLHASVDPAAPEHQIVEL
jgi:bacillithiol biosynthesis cysteine-adding enzyme BshC